MFSLIVVFIAATCPLVAAEPPAGDFYVSLAGNDTWSGTLAAPNAAANDGPFATLGRAQQAVREARGAALERAVTVLIRGGVYELAEPLRFGPQDSGAENAPVTYAAYPGEMPVFSGGSAITGWKKGEGELWTAVVPEVKAGNWYFHQLFVNGQRRTRARTPNEGYLRIAGTLVPLIRDRSKATPEMRLGFRYAEGDVERWDELDDVNVVLYHSWTASLHWIKELNEKERTVRFTNATGWPVGWWEGNERYHLENYREALDQPGEWYLERKTGTLYYWPLPGEDMTKAQVVAPRLTRLVEIQGEAELGLQIAHLLLRGLSFQNADWQSAKDAVLDGQAAVHTRAAVVANGARNVAFENCEIAHVGEYGLILGEGCKDNRVVHCHLHDLGAGGVRVGETALPQEPERQAERNVVDNCFIHDGGHVFRAGIGVWIGRSSYNTVSHNEICDFYYSGCSVGWSWGYAATTANHNLFEYNHIHDLGKGVLSDMGGIYSLGVSPESVERFNVIHDVSSYSYGGWGLYTDEGSSGMLLEKNVAYNTKSGGFHQHYGQNNVVRNNIFGFAVEDNVKSSRGDLPNTLTFERNLVLTNNHEPVGGKLDADRFKLDSNLYWDISGDEPEFLGMDFAEWQAKGKDVHGVVADPLFVDAQNHDFRLKEGSPALKLGFEPFDLSAGGLYGEPEWVEAPRKTAREPFAFPPTAGAEPIADDFEATAAGQPAANARTNGEENEASIRVTDETAASGKHSLKFTDAPGLSREWQPHLYYQCKFARGTVRASYDLRVEAGALGWNEWRDASNPYRVGPSIRVEKSGDLTAGGKTLMNVPAGKWVHFEFVCPVGKAAAGTYDLTVTLEGGQPCKFEQLPFGHKEFRRLQWFGFISLATDTAVFYLDNLKLEAAK
ncbi:MAG: right-handed parallel beta-helix repeat-containing protein [Armatimonadetes bacterium]|nr:right-handed parallel beta-helix repeat-containing protein [Armatimonadota bacterium]NCP31363.1 right-handed parallel beta-helix repeat-containing protein [Armatimonadota bacterium]NCQ29930.1 right-handed parallel beta-helix repeat-containing protein [Armatimonadota bacterium]NDK14320.1 right-handed parallel beta-helix repeat-containing protein [Armatimonadota bacterium]